MLHRPALLLLLLASLPAAAQQWATDDSGLVALNSCQLEAWWGERSSWVQPTCRFLLPVELTLGVGWLAEQAPGGRNPDFVLQAKTAFVTLEEHPVGVGLVAGLGLDRLSQVLGRGLEGAYAFVPVSLVAAEERVLVSTNLGWRFERGRPVRGGGRAPDEHALTWGVRLDVLPAERLALTAELFGDSVTGPDWQLLLHGELVPGWLLLSAGYGDSALGTGRGPGWTLGLTLTPPSLWGGPED